MNVKKIIFSLKRNHGLGKNNVGSGLLHSCTNVTFSLWLVLNEPFIKKKKKLDGITINTPQMSVTGQTSPHKTLRRQCY